MRASLNMRCKLQGWKPCRRAREPGTSLVLPFRGRGGGGVLARDAFCTLKQEKSALLEPRLLLLMAVEQVSSEQCPRKKGLRLNAKEEVPQVSTRRRIWNSPPECCASSVRAVRSWPQFCALPRQRIPILFYRLLFCSGW